MNNTQQRKIPEYWEAAPLYAIALLEYIDRELCRVYWNINQQDMNSPFDNTGETYENDIFKVEAYSWDDEIEQEYNFLYKPTGMKIRWYKYLGRITEVNKPYESKHYIEMFNNCIKELYRIEEEHEKQEWK